MQITEEIIKSNKQRKFLAIIMTITGIFLWLSSSFDREIIQGIGLFLFLLGATNINTIKKWSELSEKQKKIKIAIIVIGALLLVVGSLLYFLNN